MKHKLQQHTRVLSAEQILINLLSEEKEKAIQRRLDKQKRKMIKKLMTGKFEENL